MGRKKINPDVKALKQAVNALLSSSSERAARAAAIYIYDTFVEHPQSAREFFARRELAQHTANESELVEVE